MVPDAAHSGELYQGITKRNVFGLVPPQIQIVEPPPPQIPKLTLTGITTILGNKRALMMEAEPGGKPGQPVQEVSLILTEGQREGNVEVLLIDEHAGSVKVNNSGTIMTLTFEKDGPRMPPAQPPQPGNGIVPLLPNPVNRFFPHGHTNGMTPYPARLPRWKTTPGVASVVPPLPNVPSSSGSTSDLSRTQ